MIPIRDNIKPDRKPLINWLIIFLNGVVFWRQLSFDDAALNLFFHKYGVVPENYAGGFPEAEVLFPLLSNIFIHGGWLHFISNMWILWIFGDNVEDRMGRWRYLAFYLCCGLLASSAHIFFNLDSDMPAVGASGAIAGVMGAYVYLYPRSQVTAFLPLFFILPLFFNISAIVYIGFWLLTQIFSLLGAGAGLNIAWWAHIGGFVAGLALQFLFVRRARAQDAG